MNARRLLAGYAALLAGGYVTGIGLGLRARVQCTGHLRRRDRW